MRRLLREPLLHFLVLGTLLFALYGSLHRDMLDGPNVIVLSRAQLDGMQTRFAEAWQRPPTREETLQLVDRWVRDEVLYREGIALGFDRDDPVVRHRIGQKVAFLVEGGAPAPPTTPELQAWLDAHPADYRIESTFSLQQVYFDPTRHGDRLEEHADEARRALARGEERHGDPTMLPAGLDAASASEVARVFGDEFADALPSLPIDAWSGPIRSGFGLHLVHVTEREQERPATLDDVRADVERDLQHDRSERAAAAFYAKLRAGYTVRIEDGAATTDGAGGSEAGS